MGANPCSTCKYNTKIVSALTTFFQCWRWQTKIFCTFVLGDEVYVKAVDPTNGAITNMYGASDEVYSTFSGYMVAPVYEEFPSVVG